jgi:type I restriction enzyme S subunit
LIIQGWVSDSVTQQNRSPITDQEANVLGYTALSQSTPNLLPNDWCEIPTADTFRQISTNNKKVKTKDCKAFGKYPVIDQGQEDVAGFIDDEDRVIEVLNPLVIFGDHTRIIKWVNHNFVPGADGTKILEAATFVNPRYFYYQLKSIELPDKGYSRHFKYLNESIFRVAPLAEQYQIATKLDELLAQVDSIKTRLDTIPKILKRFRQSVLAAAVNGRLTEDWREFNSVTQLEFDTYLLDSLPVNWRCVPLGDYVENHDNNRVPISSTERQNRKGKYPYYGASGQIDTIDGYTHDGDFILIGEDGANLLTRTKPIAFSVQGKVWVNNHAHVLKCKDGYENKYFEYFINSINLAQWVSGSAQPKLNQKNMNEIPISVPPKQEQTEIIRRVEQLFTYADQIEQRVKDAQARVNQLTQSILAKAFRGELTTEWREQNPDLITGENSAEALLKSIQLERTTENTKSKTTLKVKKVE